MRELGAGDRPRAARDPVAPARRSTSLEAKRREGGGWRDRDAGALAEDILGTSAAWLLDVHPVRVRAAA